MAFTRKFLKALGLEDEKIETIMEEHVSVTDGLKKERDGYKADAEKLPEIQKKLDEQQKDSDGKDYKQLYTDLVKKNEADRTRGVKTDGYTGLLKTASVDERFWPLILKANVAEIDQLEMDGDKVKDADRIVEKMKKDYASYIPTTRTNGTDPGNPPPAGGAGGGADLGEMSMADYIAARNKK